MSYLLLTYEITGGPMSRQLALDFLGQRWTRRKLVHAIVRHEFPSLCPEKMQGSEWSTDEVLERFGIRNLQHEFVRDTSNA